MDAIVENLTQISEVIQTCERELVLYKEPKLQDLVTDLYVQLLEILGFRKGYLSSSKLALHMALRRIEKRLAEMRKLSQAVQQHVDYLHRVELRETSSRIVDMQNEQRKILQTLEDQKRILQSLQEERQINHVVQEQQKILQIVQQIQGAMQTRGTTEQIRT